MKKERESFVTQLTEQYAIPEADHAALMAEPEKVLPRILAQAHANMLEQTVRVVQAQLPQWVSAMNSQHSAAQAYETQFFSEWPELKGTEKAPVIARTLAAYRQANPNAKPEDVIREGGVAALIALRIPIPTRIAQANNAHNADATKPGASAPAVTASSASAVAPPQKSDNIFTVIAQEDVDDS